ncbi:MAG: hypothetical protein LBF74_13355, partial [Treponema sp.]|nr:hypothetical protein [Treponema sp.]
MRKLAKLGLLLAAMALVLAGCEGIGPGGDNNNNNNNNNNQGNQGDIKWNSEANGTLAIINNTQKDMIIFQGQTPSISNILGGVRAGTTKDFDVSDDVDDFDVGGYLILRGIPKDEYEKNKANLSLAKIEYSAMATYKSGKKYRTEISPSYTGDFGYKVTNSGRIGLELRKNSPDGEKIAYLPSLATNVMLYADAATSLAIFPVYVYYTKSTGQVTTLKPTDHFASVTATPRPLANASQIQSYYFPNDTTVTWDQIKGSLKSPVAYFSVSNNVPNQGIFFTLAGGNALYAQNGYDAVGTGEQLTFELESTVAGSGKNIVITLYNGSLKLPATFAGEAGNPTIKNGYDYTLEINFNGGSVSDANNYE